MVALLSEGLISSKEKVTKETTAALCTILSNCVTEPLVQTSMNSQDFSKSCLACLLSKLEELLSFKYQAEWNCVLSVLSSFFEAMPARGIETLKPLLFAMDQLRENEEFKFLSNVEVAFAAALKCTGPDFFLETLPLVPPDTSNVKDGLANGRWWLLPLFKNIKGARLGYFSANFVPMLSQLHDFSKENNDTRAFMISEQLWQTFPWFCNGAVDITTAFKPLSKPLGNCLIKPEHKAVRENVAMGLKMLIETAEDTADSTRAEKIKVLATYGKNFLPALFNIVHDTEPSKRGLVLDTVTAYSTICPPELTNKLFKKVLTKLLKGSEEKGNEEGHALCDIAMSMIPNLDSENCGLLYRTVEPHMLSGDGMLQRKSYKITRRLIEMHPDWFEASWKAVLAATNKSMLACKATKVSFLSCA